MEIPMVRSLELVRTEDEARRNILKFAKEAAREPRLGARLGYVHAWYAVPAGGGYAFGPSKFIAYREIDAKRYLALSVPSGGADGRRTERHLAQWFERVPDGSPLQGDLAGHLRDFLARFDRVVRSPARISLLRSDLEERSGREIRPASVEAAAMLDRVATDPRICGGRPVIRGTRMRVSDIVEMLAAGATRAEILADFPYVSDEDIAAALAYAARAVDHRLIRAA